MTQPSPDPRVSSIDAWRGIAAVGVAVFHNYTQNGGLLLSQAMPTAVNTMAVWGRFGVQLFFAISGFVLTYTLINRRELHHWRNVSQYFVRRSVRLDIPYLACLALYFALVPIFEKIGPLSSDDRQYSVSEVVKNVFYFVPIDKPLYIPVAWTLAVEVQFYIFFAALVVAINVFGVSLRVDRDRLVVIVIGILGVTALCIRAWSIGPVSGYWLLPDLYTFICGIVLALWFMNFKYARPLGLVYIGFVFALGVAQSNSSALASALSFVLLAVGLFVIPIRILLENRVLLWLGALSYCIYLLHQLVGGIVIDSLRRALGDAWPYPVAIVALGILGTIVASYFIHETVEVPSIKLSKRISQS